MFLYQIAFLREFRTFDDKFSAINSSTGVSESLKNMILRHRRHGQKLAVGKHEYKIIVENTMVSPNSLRTWLEPGLDNFERHFSPYDFFQGIPSCVVKM